MGYGTGTSNPLCVGVGKCQAHALVPSIRTAATLHVFPDKGPRVGRGPFPVPNPRGGCDSSLPSRTPSLPGHHELQPLNGSPHCIACCPLGSCVAGRRAPVVASLPATLLQAPCQHNFCLGCFTKWHNQGKKTCPSCRAPFSAKFASNPRCAWLRGYRPAGSAQQRTQPPHCQGHT